MDAKEVSPPPSPPDPVEAARQAIWRLFQEGYVDENMATAGLLAVDLGTRRTRSRARSGDALDRDLPAADARASTGVGPRPRRKGSAKPARRLSGQLAAARAAARRA
jgi:hypothetical protein